MDFYKSVRESIHAFAAFFSNVDLLDHGDKIAFY